MNAIERLAKNSSDILDRALPSCAQRGSTCDARDIAAAVAVGLLSTPVTATVGLAKGVAAAVKDTFVGIDRGPRFDVPTVVRTLTTGLLVAGAMFELTGSQLSLEAGLLAAAAEPTLKAVSYGFDHAVALTMAAASATLRSVSKAAPSSVGRHRLATSPD